MATLIFASKLITKNRKKVMRRLPIYLNQQDDACIEDEEELKNLQEKIALLQKHGYKIIQAS